MPDKTMYQTHDIALLYDKDRDRYTVKSPGGKKTFSNPLEAWDGYWNKVDMLMRKRIGDMLEKQGKNRFSGCEQTKFS